MNQAAHATPRTNPSTTKRAAGTAAAIGGAALLVWALLRKPDGGGESVSGLQLIASAEDRAESSPPSPCRAQLDSRGWSIGWPPNHKRVRSVDDVIAACNSGAIHLVVTGGANYGEMEKGLAAIKQAGLRPYLSDYGAYPTPEKTSP